MKKVILILSTFALLFTSCGTRRNIEQNLATCDEGVVINGVRWATRNVAGHGTFTRNPHDRGSFFTFHQARYACPPGWRLPTYEELQSLVVTDSEWTIVNRVQGRLFGTAPNLLFLPATVHGVNTYWGSARDTSATYAWGLHIRYDNTSVRTINTTMRGVSTRSAMQQHIAFQQHIAPGSAGLRNIYTTTRGAVNPVTGIVHVPMEGLPPVYSPGSRTELNVRCVADIN